MKITLSGVPGSGKSTLAKMLSKHYNIKHYSMGGLRRELANSKKITLDKLNKLGESNVETDSFVDDFQKSLDKKDSFIIDGRLSYYFIPSSIKIFITVSKNEGAERVFKRRSTEEQYNTLKLTKKQIIERITSDKQRYKNHYGITNIFDKANFDIFLDTTNRTPNKSFKILKDKIESFLKNSKLINFD